jgi:hypothetical protein
MQIKRTNERLWKSIVQKVRKEGKGGLPGQWSARKAQLSVKMYKDRGGGYDRGSSPKRSSSLYKWTKQQWRTKSGLPSVVGPRATGERYLPAKAIRKLSSKEYAATTRRKRMSRKQHSAQPKKIAKKVRRFRV